MICVVQRVSSASVEVTDPPHAASIASGLLVLAAAEPDDDAGVLTWMANKLSNLRIFADDAGRMNRSVLDIEGSVLLISQFTLAGNCDKGHRPSFIGAATPEQAEPLIEQLGQRIAATGVPVRTGVFAATMAVTSVNDGPVTVILQRAGDR
jgi:D-tyrosyl-tRNA(Tyr) deacylase